MILQHHRDLTKASLYRVGDDTGQWREDIGRKGVEYSNRIVRKATNRNHRQEGREGIARSAEIAGLRTGPYACPARPRLAKIDPAVRSINVCSTSGDAFEPDPLFRVSDELNVRGGAAGLPIRPCDARLPPRVPAASISQGLRGDVPQSFRIASNDSFSWHEQRATDLPRSNRVVTMTATSVDT